MDIQKIISLVTKTQEFIKNRGMATHVEEKGLADYVTQVDIAVQDFLNQDVRRIGSAALELAYTACGRQDGYFEIYLNPWDYAAGMLLIQEAGGQVTDFTGKPLDPRKGGSVVGTNGYVHDELLKLL